MFLPVLIKSEINIFRHYPQSLVLAERNQCVFNKTGKISNCSHYLREFKLRKEKSLSIFVNPDIIIKITYIELNFYFKSVNSSNKR